MHGLFRNVIALVLICFASCTHELLEPLPPIDYRDAFIGDYLVERSCSSWDINGNNSDTTYFDTVVVTKLNGSANEIMVDQATVPIDSNGYYFNSPWPSNWYEVKFWSDSISVRWHSGGLGGGTGCNALGVRM